MEGAVLTAVLVLAALVAYLAPSLIAFARAVPDTQSIFTLNVLAGWTVAGWAKALSRALRRPPARPQRGPLSAGIPPQWHTRLNAGGLRPPGRTGSPPPLPRPGHTRNLHLVPGGRIEDGES